MVRTIPSSIWQEIRVLVVRYHHTMVFGQQRLIFQRWIILVLVSISVWAFPTSRPLALVPLSASWSSSTQLLGQDETEYNVVIIGGGLVGSAIAVALTERGISKVKIYEQSAQPHRVGAALGLYPNGMAALTFISPSVQQDILDCSIPSRFFERRDLQDELIKVTDVLNIQAVSPVYVPWYLLQQRLVEQLPPMTIEYATRFHSYQVQSDGTVKVKLVSCSDKDSATLRTTTVTCRALIGADGIHSAVRRQLCDSDTPTSTTSQAQYYGKVMYRAVMTTNATGIANLCPPPGTQVSYQGTEKGQSFSFRETSRGIMTVTAAALSDIPTKKVECSDSRSVDTNGTKRKANLKALFAHYPLRVQQIIDAIEPSSIHQDYIRDIPIPKSWSKGPVVICGDAAHAMTPHMGQGANVGLEDACELVHRLTPILRQNYTKHTPNALAMLDQALTDFWKCRMDRVQRVQDQSRRNARQSNEFDKNSASIPFERRQYSEAFKADLYDWTPPKEEKLW